MFKNIAIVILILTSLILYTYGYIKKSEADKCWREAEVNFALAKKHEVKTVELG